MKSDTKSLSAVERLFSHSFGFTDTRGQTRQNDMAFKSDWQHKNNLLNLITVCQSIAIKIVFTLFNEGLWAERLVSWVKQGVGSPISSPARALAQDSVRSATQIIREIPTEFKCFTATYCNCFVCYDTQDLSNNTDVSWTLHIWYISDTCLDSLHNFTALGMGLLGPQSVRRVTWFFHVSHVLPLRQP